MVVPIYKKGPKGDPGNYRPVSLTSIPGKLMESIIKDELMGHLLENNLIKETQHGFFPGRSCTTNMLVFMNKVTEAVDCGDSVDIFYLDFSKAFDKVPHDKLILKLRAKGVAERVVEWIQNWLADRTQVVKVGQATSEASAVTSGVPQGSVLGPVLFTIFIDDIDDEATLLDALAKFADDTKGMKVIKGTTDKDKLQLTLDRLYRWASDWGMEFNLVKCKIMHLGRNNPGYTYTMGGQKLTVVTEEKDIGITITNNLKPAKHCQKAAGMAGAVLTQLSKNFHYRDRHVFKKLYIQYVRPHVEFASPAWSPWNEADVKLIEQVQIRAVKMVSGLKGATYLDKCRELGIETMEERRKNQDLVQAYKILTGKDKVNPTNLLDKVQPRPGAETRGNADPNNLKAKKSRLDLRKYSYPVRLPDMWNKLPADTKMAPTVKMFRNALRK